MNKRGSKGSEIFYPEVEMAEYLIHQLRTKDNYFQLEIPWFKFYIIFDQDRIINQNVFAKKLKKINIWMKRKIK